MCLIALGVVGCGVETYERRLEATRQFYAYLEKLDQNLVSAWQAAPIDVLRVPKPLQEIPAPQPVKGPDGKMELPAVDPRQPTYVNLPIKGLIGAWTGPVDVGSGQQRRTATAYLYAATNYGMFLTEEAKDAGGYTRQLQTDMEAYLQASPADEPSMTFPKGNQFVPRQTFDVTFFRPQRTINDTRYIFEFYSTRQSDNQVVLIFARPEGIDPRSKVSENLQLMLESMRVSADRPQPKQKGNTGPQAPGPAMNF